MEFSPLSHFLRSVKSGPVDSPSLAEVSLSEAYPSTPKHVLFDSSEVSTPETRDMSLNEFCSHVDAPVYHSSPVYTALLDDVLFCPVNNVITTPDRAVIKESAGPGEKTFGVDEEAIAHTDHVERIQGLCTAFRSSFENHYHLLVDHLSRFDLLNEAHFSRYEEINLLCPGGLRPPERYFVSQLCPSNVNVVALKRGALYRPEQYLFLSFPTGRTSAYIPGPYIRRLRARALHDEAPGTRHIYISRRTASHRHLRNEEALVRRLRSLGFRRHVLEDLPIPKQIRLFQEAEAVVAPHGAGLANLLFSTDATVLELQASQNVAPHFYLLCKRMGHDYYYLTHDGSHVDASFSTDPDAIVEHPALHALDHPST